MTIEVESETWREVERMIREELRVDVGAVLDPNVSESSTDFTRGRIEALTDVLKLGRPRQRVEFLLVDEDG